MITELQGTTRTLQLYEILNLIGSKKNKKERVELVRQFGERHSSFTDYLRCVFDDKIQFLLPEGKPPYTPAQEIAVPSSWHKQHLQLAYLVKGGKGGNMLPIKRERIFIGILESVHPDDAEVLVDMINKKTTCKGLTKAVVKEAIPNLIMSS